MAVKGKRARPGSGTARSVGALRTASVPERRAERVDPRTVKKGVRPAQPEAAPPLDKKALMAEVEAACGLSHGDAKRAVEATLAAMGNALDGGTELNLPGFGKLKIGRRQDQPNATVYHCRIRQPNRDRSV